MAKRVLTVIEDGLLTNLANNAAVLKEFPFLAAAARGQTRRSGCGSCNRNAKAAASMGSIKQQIASMDDTRKRRLKEILNTEKIRVSYRKGTHVAQHTF